MIHSVFEMEHFAKISIYHNIGIYQETIKMSSITYILLQRTIIPSLVRRLKRGRLNDFLILT